MSEPEGGITGKREGDAAPHKTGLGSLERHYGEQVPKLQESLAAITKEASNSLTVIVAFAVLSTLLGGAGVMLRQAQGIWVLPAQWTLWVLAGLCLLIALVAIGTFLDERGQKRDLARELASARKWAGLVSQDDEADYFNQLVTINLTNLGDYYSLVRSHAGKSFLLAASASVLGFALVAGGLGFGMAHPDSQFVAYLGAAAGTITEMVSAVFFVLYSRTVRQLKEYHDSLLQVQNVLLSLKMVESIEDPARRADLTGEVLRSLLAGAAKTGFVSSDKA